MEAKNLKLVAKTEEDLRVVSAHLQDAIANISDVANLKKNRIFLMQLNRFMWEDVEKGVFRKNKRIRTILKFENVIKTHAKNINQSKGKKFLDFLTIESNQMIDNILKYGNVIQVTTNKLSTYGIAASNVTYMISTGNLLIDMDTSSNVPNTIPGLFTSFN